MTEMAITEQQACRLLQVTPITLNMYVATRRLSVTRKRTIRGLVVSYDETEVKALKKELQDDEEFVRRQYVHGYSSSKTAEAEFVDVETDPPFGNGTNSSVSASAPLIERLLLLLEGLTPSDHPKVAIEKKLMLTLAEAAAYSGLSEARLGEAIRAEKLKARKDLGKGYRIKRADIEAFISSI